MTAYDEARAAGLAALHADSEWHYSDGTGAWRANYGRAVDLILAAAWPHLTDDGAADTPPADTGVGAPSAAESATPAATGAATPSSPHPVDERDAAIAATKAILYNLPVDGFGQDKRLEDYAAIWGNAAAKAVLALSGEGATPAIDREALIKAIAGEHGDWLTRYQAGLTADRVLALIGAPNSGASEDDR